MLLDDGRVEAEGRDGRAGALGESGAVLAAGAQDTDLHDGTS
jgi:hypothetical protein